MAKLPDNVQINLSFEVQDGPLIDALLFQSYLDGCADQARVAGLSIRAIGYDEAKRLFNERRKESKL